MPALRSGVNPLAFRMAAVIAVMICCSVNALPPTTIVCAAAMPLTNSASAAQAPRLPHERFMQPPFECSSRAKRVDTARYEPILRLTEQKIHGHRKQRRRNRTRQHHPMLLQVDARENKLAQAPAAN